MCLVKNSINKQMKDGRCHNRPRKGEQNRYLTAEYLMCGKCKKKLRRLSGMEKNWVAKGMLTKEGVNIYKLMNER